MPALRSAMASSNSSRGVSARRMPAAAQSASTATAAGASEPVCERAARAPAALRPGASSTTGRPDETTAAAAAANARPSPRSSA